MKKLLTISLLVLLCVSVSAQTVTLTFTGRDANSSYCQLDSVVITNLANSWQEIIYWPDTVLSMHNGTGISEANGNSAFGLLQNNPNPFNGTTEALLNIVESGNAVLAVTDINGRLVAGASYNGVLDAGTHRFRISVSNTGTYVLTVRQNGRTSSVKMVNNGDGVANGIEYVGNGRTTLLKNGAKGNTTKPFQFGNTMEYVGYATINGEVAESRITQAQGSSQTLAFEFDVAETPQDAQPCPGTPTVTDADGNTYSTVQIGSQCWMAENLRTTKYADGTSVSPSSPSVSTSTTVAYWYYPDGNSSNKATYGLFYNWPAVMHNSSSSSSVPSGVQGVCPNGWHVPSDQEWTNLTDYVSSQSVYQCGATSTYIAKALASTEGWTSDSHTCSVGNNPSSNNSTGFGALPAGGYSGASYGTNNSFGNNAYYWSATQYSDDHAYNRNLYHNSAYLGRSNNDKYFGFSVRCLRD